MISDILLKALFKGKLDSSLDYEIYEKAFLPTASSFEKKSIYKKILEMFKLDVMQGNHEACLTLAKVYKLGFYVKKDEYTAILLTLIGYELENEQHKKAISACPIKCKECEKFKNIPVLSPPEYEILKPTANNFICNYIGRSDITFDDAILLSACSDTLNTSILGDPNYNNMYNLG
ncbi:MAG TPA: hypothetical protein LFW20_04095 [Rickettsia endosymbiont of Omalisus fontisbellaquei]|nr:hypothetical protein [Rickettsia endosymbiont of Omalisus fontisbellaquei]